MQKDVLIAYVYLNNFSIKGILSFNHVYMFTNIFYTNIDIDHQST